MRFASRMFSMVCITVSIFFVCGCYVGEIPEKAIIISYSACYEAGSARFDSKSGSMRCVRYSGIETLEKKRGYVYELLVIPRLQKCFDEYNHVNLSVRVVSNNLKIDSYLLNAFLYLHDTGSDWWQWTGEKKIESNRLYKYVFPIKLVCFLFRRELRECLQKKFTFKIFVPMDSLKSKPPTICWKMDGIVNDKQIVIY